MREEEVGGGDGLAEEKCELCLCIYRFSGVVYIKRRVFLAFGIFWVRRERERVTDSSRV